MKRILWHVIHSGWPLVAMLLMLSIAIGNCIIHPDSLLACDVVCYVTVASVVVIVGSVSFIIIYPTEPRPPFYEFELQAFKEELFAEIGSVPSISNTKEGGFHVNMGKQPLDYRGY